MIATCPHCSRPVSNDETIGFTSLGWVPTSCCNGDGPTAIKGAVITNHLYFYVSAIRDLDHNLKNTRVLLGPYSSYEEAESNISLARKLSRSDPRSPWYSYGVCSSNVEHKTMFGTGKGENS
jgi:hypothetical protein